MQDIKARYLIRITCFQCHKKGHFQENPPLEKKADARSVNEETIATEYKPSTDWRYNIPEDLEAENKGVNDITCNFVNNCVW